MAPRSSHLWLQAWCERRCVRALGQHAARFGPRVGPTRAFWVPLAAGATRNDFHYLGQDSNAFEVDEQFISAGRNQFLRTRTAIITLRTVATESNTEQKGFTKHCISTLKQTPPLADFCKNRRRCAQGKDACSKNGRNLHFASGLSATQQGWSLGFVYICHVGDVEGTIARGNTFRGIQPCMR